jgi:hypothetical protein
MWASHPLPKRAEAAALNAWSTSHNKPQDISQRRLIKKRAEAVRRANLFERLETTKCGIWHGWDKANGETKGRMVAERVQGSGRTNGVFEGAGGLVVDAADCGACYGGAVMGVGEEGVAAPGAMQFQNSAWL